MKISIQNVGIILDATVEINGISLIAGPNDSGKSTIGKAFYSLIRGLNPDEDIFISEKNDTIRNYYQNILKILKDNKSIDLPLFQTNRINTDWVNKVRVTFDYFEGLQLKHLKRFTDFIEFEIALEFNGIINKQREIFNYLQAEFNDEIESVYENDKITRIYIEDLEGSATITYDIFIELNNNISTFFDNVFFIESPSIIDKTLQDSISYEIRFSRDRRNHLKFALANKSNYLNTDDKCKKEQDKIIDIISKIVNGKFIVDDFQGVVFEKNGVDINIENVAQGIKGFGLIELLLKNNQLNSRTLLIIDEPEIHLHPNWQVLYAEILVILSKKLEIPILLTSHSPYFIEALKAYSEKYDFNDKTFFYFSEKAKDGLGANIFDVSKNISPILSSISEAHFKISEIE